MSKFDNSNKNIKIFKSETNFFDNNQINLNPSTQLNENLKKSYEKFFNFINPLVGIRARIISLYDLRYCVEEIYTVLFYQFCNVLRNNKKNLINMDISFSKNVYEFYENKFNKKALIDQNCMNLLKSVYEFKKDYDDIRIFSNFLTEEYTFEDFMFFLFLRANVEKELKILFIEKAKDETKIQHMDEKELIFMDLYLNINQIKNIINNVFNNDEEILLNQVFLKIQKFFDTKNYIPVNIFLIVLTDDFHISRSNYEEITSFNQIPFFYNKQNEFFDLSNNNNENNEQDMFMNMLIYFNNLNSNFTESLKNILITYIKEKQILNFFEKYFENEFNNNNSIEIIYELRNCVIKKIYYLIIIIFNNDVKSFNACFNIENNENKNFTDLIKILNELMKSRSIIDINEKLVDEFCENLLNIPQLINQISTMIEMKKKQII
jgi:hypothetical protein